MDFVIKKKHGVKKLPKKDVLTVLDVAEIINVIKRNKSYILHRYIRYYRLRFIVFEFALFLRIVFLPPIKNEFLKE